MTIHLLIPITCLYDCPKVAKNIILSIMLYRTSQRRLLNLTATRNSNILADEVHPLMYAGNFLTKKIKKN